MWLRHPRTGKKDTMLTIGIAGFVFSGIFLTASVVMAGVFNDPLYLDNAAMIIGAILTPTLASYTVRKYTDFKNGNNSQKGKEE